MNEEKKDIKKTIYLTLLNGTGYVFSVNDYMQLRMQHHVVGALVGTCKKHGWDPNENVLPIELTACETRLLLEKGIAVLCCKSKALLSKPTDVELQAYQLTFDKRIMEQKEALNQEKLRESERNIAKIIEGKRRKLLKDGVPEEAIKLEPATVLQEIAEKLQFDNQNALLEISCEHPNPHAAQIVRLPADNSLKYCVFRDFWQKGKFITAGDSFGADFLIYPGDPLLYHASHIVILLNEPLIEPMDVIAKVRLSVIVNKICMFAYFATADQANAETIDTEVPEVHYQTITWEGNREKDKPNTTSAAT